ncbi:hypothetical protein DITRI_Ditri05aG0061700 [Diplodiscus trichospermus]
MSRSVLATSCRWCIGDGWLIKVWQDPWVMDNIEFKLSTPLVDGFEEMRVYELWLPGRKEWNVTLLQQLFCEDDGKAILSLPLAMHEEEDRLIRHYEKKGCYLVRSGYRVAVHEVLQLEVNRDVCSWSKIWTLKILPRVKAFM